MEVALELRDEFVAPADGERRLLLELVEVRGRAGRGDLGDDRGRFRADAVQLRERSSGDASDERVRREGLHDLGRSQVGADAVRLLPRSVKQVRDAFQRLCGLHTGNATFDARTTKGRARFLGLFVVLSANGAATLRPEPPQER